jgi:hypothetical protein
MNTLARTFVALFVAVAVMFTSTGVAAAVVVASTGIVTIQVDGRGDDPDLYLPVPAALVGLGLSIADIAMPPDAKARMRRELAEVRPVLEAVSRGLSEMPDATLVEVETDNENVSIVKRGGNFEIRVDEARGEHVRISVPVGVIDQVTDFLTR